MKLVIKNGRVMDPASGRDEVTNIWVEDEKIIGFGEHPEWAEEAEELNAEGCVVAPGLVDCLLYTSFHRFYRSNQVPVRIY